MMYVALFPFTILSPEDEDDDNGSYFQLEKAAGYDYLPQAFALITPCPDRVKRGWLFVCDSAVKMIIYG